MNRSHRQVGSDVRARRSRSEAGRFGVEYLEERTLLAVSATLDATGLLEVTATGADQIKITCKSGKVRINGANPSGGTIKCADVKELVVNGGSGANLIDLKGVTKAKFAADLKIAAFGNDGNDTIYGSEYGDSLVGGAGSDTLYGGDGGDFLCGDDVDGTTAANDALFGDGGIDFLLARGDVDFTLTASVLQGLGTDQIQGIERAQIFGGPSANRIDASGFSGSTLLVGAEGNDTLIGSAFDDVLVGQDGDDILHGNGGNDILLGQDGDDTMLGGYGDDELQGGDGDDHLFGDNLCVVNPAPCKSGGNDLLNGGLGKDVVSGGPGDDIVSGGNDYPNDLDTLYGGAGNDTFIRYHKWNGSMYIALPETIADFESGDKLKSLWDLPL